jgi:hypothetical protein
MATTLANIRFRCSAVYFNDVALPHLIENSAHLELNYLFVNKYDRVFEHVIVLPSEVSSLSLITYTNVFIYGCSKLLIWEAIDHLLRKNYMDFEELSPEKKYTLKSQSQFQNPKQDISGSAWHQTRMDMLLQAGMDNQENGFNES